MIHRRLAAAILTLAGLSASGCAADFNPVRDLAVAAGATGGEPKPAPDFISNSRRANTDFIPVGTSAPKRAERPKSRSEVAGAEAEMDGARNRNEAIAAQTRKPGQ